MAPSLILLWVPGAEARERLGGATHRRKERLGRGQSTCQVGDGSAPEEVSGAAAPSPTRWRPWAWAGASWVVN